MQFAFGHFEALGFPACWLSPVSIHHSGVWSRVIGQTLLIKVFWDPHL